MTLPQWPMPNITTKSDGLPRQVGVEFEVQGIDVDTLARLIALTLRGKDETVSEAEYLISVPTQGDSRVEVDYALLKPVAKEQHPEEYDRRLTDPEYWPNLETLIVDYLGSNASRDRAMDMLPLFYEISPDVVRTAVDGDRIKPRPAFHYRLANCAIDEPDWSIADPWRRWLQIEHLASDGDLLNDCCEEYRSSRQRPGHRIDDSWRETVAKWLRQW